jgi:hypothetical protein
MEQHKVNSSNIVKKSQHKQTLKESSVEQALNNDHVKGKV